jgi:beta-lactamase class A
MAGKFGKRARLIAVALLVLAGGAPSTVSALAGGQASQGLPPRPIQQSQPPVTQVNPAPARPLQLLPAADAQRALADRITDLGGNFDGIVGIAVRDVETGWTTSWNGQRYFPQQSVSKFWVALTALQAADAGRLDLSRQVTLTRDDLTLFHQPVAADIGPNGYTATLDQFMFRALTTSDNTCNDLVLRHAGGPEAVRAMLARNGLDGIRFGPGERIMQSEIAGLRWQPAFSRGNAFYQARAAVPVDRRRLAFNRYVEDPVDGATPEGIVAGLARLQRGELLSQRSTARLLSILAQVRTGPQRLKGGLAPGWQIAHKTGTGQVFNGEQAGYNDIGILTAPDGRHYAVAVMIGRTATPLGARMALMQNVTRAVIAYHEATGFSAGTQLR